MDYSQNLRQEKVPEKYVALFCMPDIKLSTLMDTVKRIEATEMTVQVNRNQNTEKSNKKKQGIICYKCNKSGHFAKECKDKAENKANMVNLCNTKIDECVIKFNDKDYIALFDTGSSHSFIGIKLARMTKQKIRHTNTVCEFRLASNQIIIDIVVHCNIEYAVRR